MLRRVCSAWIFIRPIAVPSPNNARPSFVRAVPSAREIQPRPQLRISPGLTHTRPCLHTRSEYYAFYTRAGYSRGLFFFYLAAVYGGSVFACISRHQDSAIELLQGLSLSNKNYGGMFEREERKRVSRASPSFRFVIIIFESLPWKYRISSKNNILFIRLADPDLSISSFGKENEGVDSLDRSCDTNKLLPAATPQPPVFSLILLSFNYADFATRSNSSPA